MVIADKSGLSKWTDDGDYCIIIDTRQHSM